MIVLVNVFHAFGSVESFCNHFHFDLGAFYAVSFSDHGSEYSVSAEVGITCYKQVAQINRVNDIPFYRMYCFQETVHFLCGVRHQYRLEVIAIFQSVTDTGGNGIYVLENRGVFRFVSLVFLQLLLMIPSRRTLTDLST